MNGIKKRKKDSMTDGRVVEKGQYDGQYKMGDPIG